ncbi:hypothetical protein JCM12681A_68460 [Streptomyces mexicanus]
MRRRPARRRRRPDGGGAPGPCGGIGLVTCFRQAGLGIADLRGFIALLRSEHPPQQRVAFLRERRAALEQRVTAPHRAMEVLDDKIAYCS